MHPYSDTKSSLALALPSKSGFHLSLYVQYTEIDAIVSYIITTLF